MEFEKQLQGLMTLQDPGATFTDKVLASLRARMNGRSKARSRLIVISVMATALAAAAMLSVHLMNPSPPVSAALAPTPVPHPVESVGATGQPDPDSHDPVPPEEKVELVENTVKPFTVLVLPLKNEATTPAGKAAASSMYAAFLDLLRNTPGAKLLEPNPTENASEPQPDHQIAITGRPFESNVQVDVEALSAAASLRFFTGTMIDVMPSCKTTLVDGLETGPAYCRWGFKTA